MWNTTVVIEGIYEMNNRDVILLLVWCHLLAFNFTAFIVDYGSECMAVVNLKIVITV